MLVSALTCAAAGRDWRRYRVLSNGCRRHFPGQFLRCRRAGHGAVSSTQLRHGYTAFVRCKVSRLQNVSGVHTGTMGYGKMEGEAADKDIACMLERAAADDSCYRQEWLGIKAA